MPSETPDLRALDDYADRLELEIEGSVEEGVEVAETPAAVRAGAGALVAVAVVLTAMNLRPVITGVGPLLAEMRGDLGTSALWAGVLTTLPGFCFAGAGFAAPAVARRLGVGRAIAVALGVLTLGTLIRVLDGPGVVLGGTLVATAGIAVINVLIPVVIRQSFPARIGVMTGIYTAALQGGGAAGSALTPILDGALGGWRQALASWAAMSAIALLTWLLSGRAKAGPVVQPQPAAGPGSGATAGRRSLLGSPLAWVVTIFFGLQSFIAYVMMGWLPQVFIDSGVGKVQAGLLMGLVSVIAVPISLVIPPMAAKQKSQSPWIVGLGLSGLAGVIGLLIDPGAVPLLWSALLGIGMSVFSLALTVIALRARSDAETAQLSGMAQGFGYLLAGVGPFVFGTLHGLTGGWTVPLALLLVVWSVQMVFGALSGRNRYV
ncbi:CynX/NimT family MFS transporter [Microlunatus soli]|uniref:MFS transporter, CP family, cyanate transporter n=1 Tax=Microlunatus soli TaxID=630515 RepID=A0A1H1V183_9ACTN|nr:MFS transporter [Microlunatus soli]SDS78537.1 MFS transporter, CP family, cyanate transporter [Microlunatus soli]